MKCLDGAGKACHTMRLFPSTHLEAELIPETLIKRCLGHGKKGVTEQSYIKIMGRRDVRRKYVESVGLGFSHVPTVPTRSLAYVTVLRGIRQCLFPDCEVNP